MISPKIKKLLQFVKYLHSNLNTYGKHLEDVKRYDDLGLQKSELKPGRSYREKEQYELIKKERKNLGRHLETVITKPIIEKGLALGVYYDDANGVEASSFSTEVIKLKDKANSDIEQVVLNYAKLFKELFEQREVYNRIIQRYLIDVENDLKGLFSFFDMNLKEVFYPTPTKLIQPTPPSDKKQRLFKSTQGFFFFQINLIGDLEYEGATYKDVKQRNNDSILTPENWEQHKETFFIQRMATYKDSYTLVEKIKLELQTLEKLPINETDYQILKGRYKAYLEQKQALTPQQSTKEDLNENTEPNNLTISTIEDWLFEFKERYILTEPHYTNLVSALTHYFENGAFPKLEHTIKVGRVNKKLLGWHLNRIFHSEGKGVEIDLLSFAKANISTFKDVEFDEKNIQNSNLYKYFTTKTK